MSFRAIDYPELCFPVTMPIRVKFYTQEIVFFRQDLLYRMRRSCLIPCSKEEADDPFQHVKFLILFTLFFRATWLILLPLEAQNSVFLIAFSFGSWLLL